MSSFVINSGNWNVKQDPKLQPTTWSQSPAGPAATNSATQTETTYDYPTAVATSVVTSPKGVSQGSRARVGGGVVLGVVLMVEGGVFGGLGWGDGGVGMGYGWV